MHVLVVIIIIITTVSALKVIINLWIALRSIKMATFGINLIQIKINFCWYLCTRMKIHTSL